MTLQEALTNPSVESWTAVVAHGTKIRQPNKFLSQDWEHFASSVAAAVKAWPPEIERICPVGWPKGFKSTVEHRVLETDTYGHYIQGICSHPDLRLADGSQAVWLERRFTGGVVQMSTVQQALKLIGRALSTLDMSYVATARNLLMNGVRQVGKVGCADTTGGVTVERAMSARYQQVQGQLRATGTNSLRHEYRLEVEVKVGNQPQSPEQVARMNSVRRRGGCYIVARSVAEAVEQIKAFIASVG